MSVATLPKAAGYLQALSTYQIAQSSARRAQRRLDMLLRQRGASPQELESLSLEVEELWSRVDRAGSAFARAREVTARRLGVA